MSKFFKKKSNQHGDVAATKGTDPTSSSTSPTCCSPTMNASAGGGSSSFTPAYDGEKEESTFTTAAAATEPHHKEGHHSSSPVRDFFSSHTSHGASSSSNSNGSSNKHLQIYKRTAPLNGHFLAGATVFNLDRTAINPSSTVAAAATEATAAAAAAASSAGVVVTSNTAPRHGWASQSADVFKVRHGPNYAKAGTKSPSQPSLYQLVAVDWFAAGTKLDNMMDKVTLHLPADDRAVEECKGFSHVPSILAFNVQLPQENPQMMNVPLDGASLHCVLYFAITPESLAGFANIEEAKASLKLLERYFKTAEADEKMKGRLKLIGQCTNIDALNLPSMIEQYNGKPVLITKSGSIFTGETEVVLENSGSGDGGGGCSGVANGGPAAAVPTAPLPTTLSETASSNGMNGITSDGGGGGGDNVVRQRVRYVEVDINIRHWCFLARKGLKAIQPKFTEMEVQVAFVIEARHDEEMPEQVLGCAFLSKLDPTEALYLQ